MQWKPSAGVAGVAPRLTAQFRGAIMWTGLASLAGPLGLPLGFARGFGKTGQAFECARPHMGIAFHMGIASTFASLPRLRRLHLSGLELQCHARLILLPTTRCG